MNCKITDVSSKEFSTSTTDCLQKSVGTIEIYRGLASEAYIAWSTVDPVDNAFVLSDKLQKLSKVIYHVKLLKPSSGLYRIFLFQEQYNFDKNVTDEPRNLFCSDG